MAGIEKVCELSGEYPGWRMYGYKHNHIQIMPHLRKKFRGAEHTLEIEMYDLVWICGSLQWYYDPNEWKIWIPPYSSENEFKNDRVSGRCRLLTEWKFTLIVTDNNLQGNVEGEYVNFTTDLPATKRRLKRMLRCKKLNIIKAR